MSENKRVKLNATRYALIFLTVTIGMLIHGIFAHRNTELNYIEWVLAFAYVPFFITAIFYVVHRVMLKIRPDSPELRRQEAYVLEMSQAVKDTLQFTPEDFTMLQRSTDFQNAMFYGYQIFNHGPTSQANYEKMIEPFESETKAYQAVEVIIDTIKQKRH